MILSPERLRQTRIVLLDRDGVINRKAPEGSYIKNTAELELLPGVPEAIRMLNRLSILVIIVTNQRGIALGQLSNRDLDDIHNSLSASLAAQSAHVDAIYYCPHDLDQCDCRKPKTGMLAKAFHDFPIATRENSILIGDSANDVRAAKTFGIPAILIVSEDQRSAYKNNMPTPDFTAASLLEAVKWIIFHRDTTV